MIQPFKINYDFSTYSDADFSLKAKHIIDTMAANVLVYATPAPTLASITTLLNTYNTALAKAQHGSQADTTAKDVARKAVETPLKTLGKNYVQPIAGSDETKLQQSGFDYSGGETTAVTQNPAPPVFDIDKNTAANTATLNQSSQQHTRVYMWQYIAVPAGGAVPPSNAPWQWAFSTKSKITILGLVSDTAYYFRAASYSADGAINWSSAKKYTVQGS